MGRARESVATAGDGYVELTTGDKFVTRSLIWCVGVRADPLVDGLDLIPAAWPGVAGQLQTEVITMAQPGNPTAL